MAIGELVCTVSCRSKTYRAIGERSRFDPLAPVAEPRWLVVQTLAHERQHVEQLPAGTDLGAALAWQFELLAAEGWVAESDYEWGVTFVRRGAERPTSATLNIEVRCL